MIQRRAQSALWAQAWATVSYAVSGFSHAIPPL
jgi:hypothetical protein